MAKFEVQTTEEQGIVVLALQGYLDAHTAPEFEKTLQKVINQNQYRIVADLQQLRYISSAGLGVFMGFIEEIREKGGDIRFCSTEPKVYKIFELLGFPALFRFFPDRQGALASFQQDASNQES
ncbi:MAG: anti-sigma factor antagonist [Calditrichaeota bacterium]|nr:MAG: anti-sigma factor antagonist [Calditrichota bacterium]